MKDDGPAVPWSFSEARTTFVAVIAGGALLVCAWWESSGTAKLRQQTTWANVGVLALVLIAVGGVFWVSAGRRAVKARTRELTERLLEATPPARSSASLPSPAGGPGYFTVSGSTRYHRGDCLLVRTKEVVRFDLTSADGAEVRPCEMCNP